MSIIQSINDFDSFLSEHYASSSVQTLERKTRFIDFISKYIPEYSAIKVASVRGNGYCIINAFLAYLQYTGQFSPIEVEDYYTSIKEVILSSAESEMLEKTGEVWTYQLDTENNIEIEPVMLGILMYLARPIRISVISYKDGIGELRKIVFNEECDDDHYIFLNKNGHLYALLLPKQERISIHV